MTDSGILFASALKNAKLWNAETQSRRGVIRLWRSSRANARSFLRRPPGSPDRLKVETQIRDRPAPVPPHPAVLPCRSAPRHALQAAYLAARKVRWQGATYLYPLALFDGVAEGSLPDLANCPGAGGMWASKSAVSCSSVLWCGHLFSAGRTCVWSQHKVWPTL